MSADTATFYPNDEAGEIDAVAAAEAALAEIQQNFGAWVGEDLDQARAAFERTRSGGSAEARAEAAHDIYTAAHNIKGYAATFGYQLVTDIADSLCRLVKSVETMTPEALELAETHLSSLGTVIGEEMTGDGGEVGRTLLADLIQGVDAFAEAA